MRTSFSAVQLDSLAAVGSLPMAAFIGPAKLALVPRAANQWSLRPPVQSPAIPRPNGPSGGQQGGGSCGCSGGG